MRPHSRRTRRPAQTCAAPCSICKRTPWRNGVGGCDPLDIRGLPRLAHAWPPELNIADDNPCQCAAPVGGYHHWPCDIEVCPWADSHPDDGEQLLCCGCME